MQEMSQTGVDSVFAERVGHYRPIVTSTRRSDVIASGLLLVTPRGIISYARRPDFIVNG